MRNNDNEGNNNEINHFLDSKIKKLKIELPHYNFSHSSHEESHAFIGRKQILEKLKKLIESTADKTGVYLVAGNRGVGKTRLVNQAINETSLKPNFFKLPIYLFVLLVCVAFTDIIMLECSLNTKSYSWLIYVFFCIVAFIYESVFNNFRVCLRKYNDSTNQTSQYSCKDSFSSAIKDLSFLLNPFNADRYRAAQIIFLVCYTQSISGFFNFVANIAQEGMTPTKVFVFYISFVFSMTFWRFIDRKECKIFHGNGEYHVKEVETPNSSEYKNTLEINFALIHLIILPALFHLFRLNLLWWYLGIFPMAIIVICCIFVCKLEKYNRSISNNTSGSDVKNVTLTAFFKKFYMRISRLFVCLRIICFRLLFSEIRRRRDIRKRLYLRINFGHKLKDEKDILRLITRTLSTEYSSHILSFRRMYLWWTLAFGFLLFFACMFCTIVEQQNFYKPIINSNFYKSSSQRHLKDKNESIIIFDFERFLTLHTYNKEEVNKTPLLDKNGLFSKNYNIALRYLLVLDHIVFEISKKSVEISQRLWYVRDKKLESWVPIVNYLFLFSFFLIYLCCTLLFRTHWFTKRVFATHGIIKRHLNRLNSDITHSSERESGININAYEKLGIVAKTKKSRGIADAPEIEKELQDILNRIQCIPVFMCRPDIVIIFDELDKVEPDESHLESDTLKTKATIFSINATRERQTEILKILSNMKYFLSSADAKFIFIAGREMYDIYLADVSDRTNYIGSIFNAVIYVPSFLTDHSDTAHSDITSLTEEFVCRKLIPNDYLPITYDLKSYTEYLYEKIYIDSKNNTLLIEKAEKEIPKIIAVLQHFIVYLAHVSKGAPKKMIQLFESFIEISEENTDKNDKTYLRVQYYNNSRMFLKFGYNAQYILGFTAYLITPIFYRLIQSNIRVYSDKLLISSLRFVDFLLKFHKNSFSWTNLDISPEMLEANRSPELKSITTGLINYLAHIHINKSSFSLYDYKFDSLIANEIFVMTKTDEVFSALNSFSLDETLSLKEHYLDLLKNKQKEYQNYKNNNSAEFTDIISQLQIVIGDLYHYDDDLEEAGIYYKSAVQTLRNSETISLAQHYFYVQNMLKLGMIYEKRKQNELAYMTYSEICKWITEPSNIITFKEISVEQLKLFYLPFVAKLQILEKSHFGGITRKHLDKFEEDIKLLTNDNDNEDTIVLNAEMYSRVADILYYKNNDLKRSSLCENEKTQINSSCTACEYYHKALSILLKTEGGTIPELLKKCIENIYENCNMKYCTALARILSDWGNVFYSCDKTFTDIDNSKCRINNGKECNTKNLINFNKCSYFTTSERKRVVSIVNSCIKYVGSEGEKDTLKEDILSDSMNKMEISLAMYSIASKAYCKASLYKRSAYQIYKMLRLFKAYKIYICRSTNTDILSKRALRSLWYAAEDLNQLELKKREKDLKQLIIKRNAHKSTLNEETDNNINMKELLLDSEIDRIWLLIMNLESQKEKLTSEKIKEYYEKLITSPYGIVYSLPARIYRLHLKSNINFEAYKNITNMDQIDSNLITQINSFLNSNVVQIIFGSEEKNNKIFEDLVAETIYCFKEIIQLSKRLDETYIFSHNFMGAMHLKLSFWIRLYETYKNVFLKDHESSLLNSNLEYYLGKEWREQLSSNYENQRALSYYYKSLENHRGGKAYHNMIENMCWIKDDYNDRSDHFNIAEERHYILNGKTEEYIEKLKKNYEKSSLYKVDNYIKTQGNEK